eukprot:10891525-Heterocapsa_arctica.AAC.1
MKIGSDRIDSVRRPLSERGLLGRICHSPCRAAPHARGTGQRHAPKYFKPVQMLRKHSQGSLQP